MYYFKIPLRTTQNLTRNETDNKPLNHSAVHHTANETRITTNFVFEDARAARETTLFMSLIRESQQKQASTSSRFARVKLVVVRLWQDTQNQTQVENPQLLGECVRRKFSVLLIFKRFFVAQIGSGRVFIWYRVGT